jgi:Putative RNA methylase family UPF0020
MSALAKSIKEKFSEFPPLFLASDTAAIKLELKPYLQPFEEILAQRELRALMLPGDRCVEAQGYWLLYSERPEAFLRDNLTYWQRVGRAVLALTAQNVLELTQNGADIRSLHRSRRLRYGPHDIHEYRGKFFPQLVRSLITTAGTAEDGIVLDPMSGSGTTPCEAIALGRSALAADLNPLSVLISTVKASVPTLTAEEFEGYLVHWRGKGRFKSIKPSQVWGTDDLTYLERWFNESAIGDLARLRGAIDESNSGFERSFLQVCLSNIVRSVSWQKETDLRVRKEVRPYEPGQAIERFKENLRQQGDRIHAYLSVLPRQERTPSLCVREGNSVEVDRLFAEFRGRVDVVITSPPYATALPYLDTDRLSLVVLGLLGRKVHKEREAGMIGTREVSERERLAHWERYEQRKHELPGTVITLIDHVASFYHAESDAIGFRRRNLPALLGKYFVDMLDAMGSARALMRRGGRGYYVVGNNSTEIHGERVEIATDEFLFAIGEAAGWKQDEVINMELLPSRDIFKENRGSKEVILCFKTY